MSAVCPSIPWASISAAARRRRFDVLLRGWGGGGCGEHQTGDPLGIPEAELHRDETAHAQPDDGRSRDLEVVQQLDDRIGEAAHRHDLIHGPRLAVAGEVGRDDAELVRERLELRSPHRAAERMAVEEDDRRAVPAVLVRERRERHPGRGYEGRRERLLGVEPVRVPEQEALGALQPGGAHLLHHGSGL